MIAGTRVKSHMSNSPKLTTGSEIEAYLRSLPEWRELIDGNVVDLLQIKLYLLAYPAYLPQILQLSAWANAKSTNDRVLAFLDFMRSFPAEKQADESAIASVFGGGMFMFSGKAWGEDSEFIESVCDLMVTVALNREPDLGVYFWIQVLDALRQVSNPETALEKFQTALARNTYKSENLQMLKHIKEVVRRDAVYKGGLPWEQQQTQELLKDLRFRRSAEIHTKLLE
jgi:hypothetical protein